jgi:hypothetical protein
MSIRGRVDVYCTIDDQTFVAIATSSEINESGRPVVVRVVEFQATEPLYKATQIGDFGDFEFRVTELHDEIVTLIQMQQRWDLVPADARWWPLDPQSRLPLRAAELIYATLGPYTTTALMEALRNSDLESERELRKLFYGLDRCLGRRPAMLVALATAIGATDRHWHCHDLDDSEIRRGGGVDRMSGETLKHLGGLVIESFEQFGFSRESFGEWYESQSRLFFDHHNWPPPQVPYTLEYPEFAGSLPETPIEIFEFVRGPFSDSPNPDENPMVSPERLTILSRLQEISGISWAIGGPAGDDRILTRDEARAWARLVAATVQAWHDNLANPEVRLGSPYADDMFTYNLLESICAVPRESWTRLTDARRICLIADLGELLMVISELSGGDITSRAAGALGSVCNYEDDLISFGEQAGLALPYQNGRMEFDSGIDSIRGFVPFD